MNSELRVKKIPHPDFAQRMIEACGRNPDVPLPNYGRLGWFVEQMDTRFGVNITQETVRKWFAGESRPRQGSMVKLAALLEEDVAWLSLGATPGLSQKDQKVRNAAADGAVNVLAGLIQMDGGSPAFPTEDDARARDGLIDLYAIIRGAQYSLHVVTAVRGEDSWTVSIPFGVSDSIVIAVLPIGDLKCEFVEMPWDQVELEGKRKAGAYEVVLPCDYASKWKQIKTFAERL